MQPVKKSVWLIFASIAVLSTSLALLGAGSDTQATVLPATSHSDDGIVRLSTSLVQDKILIGSDGRIALALDLVAMEMPARTGRTRQHIDLAVVLDRSGSMAGKKIEDARHAIIRMLEWFSPGDRLALVVYDHTVQTLLPLAHMNESQRRHCAEIVAKIRPGGYTNLGGGLQAGIEAVLDAPAEGRQRKVILISDGLANHGIIDPAALGRMAANASAQGIAVSTVGVGYDFNEVLMTALADHGTGRYHFLEDPGAFAAVLQHEFEDTRNVAASGLEIQVPLKNGWHIVDAGGYPILRDGEVAVIQPGDLLSGRVRRIFLTFELPPDRARQHTIDGLRVSYQHAGRPFILSQAEPLHVDCVADESAVVAGINATVWGNRVVQEDFGRLKESVADAIRKGEKENALELIRRYESYHSALNSRVASPQVSENLAHALPALRTSVEDTFIGSPAEVAEKQNQKAKTIQFEGYRIRRDKK